MKRIATLIISCILLILTLVGCENNNSRDLSEVIRKIDFSMTENDVRKASEDKFIERDSNESGNVFLVYKGELDGFSGEIRYRFDENGKLDFIKFTFGNEKDYSDFMESFIKQNGQPDKEAKYFDMWNGNVTGESAIFAASKDSMMIEVDKEQ